MNEHLKMMREKVRNGFYKQYRRDITTPDIMGELTRRCVGATYNARNRMAYELVLSLEKPIVFPDEKIIFTRTIKGNPMCVRIGEGESEENLNMLALENLCPDWQILLKEGLEARREAALKSLQQHQGDGEAEDYLQNTIRVLDLVMDFARQYAQAACTAEQKTLLEKVPMRPAESFHEALQSLRFVSAMMRLAGGIHLGFGRFDQYMWPYLERDLQSGRLDMSGAKDLLEEFFIANSRDSDLYRGVQQGDNGQSLMLGGCDREGNSAINPLTYLALEASEEVGLIDPKINLRVDSNTPDDLLLLAAKLTRRGLGFPQYSNDEIVIPGLVKFGYDLQSARNYTVAACWEYVVEDGRDCPNLFAMNFALAADKAIRESLRNHEDFAQIMVRTKDFIRAQVQDIVAQTQQRWQHLPELLLSALCQNPIPRGRDLNNGGGTHYHYGCHGCGSANAADALAAVRYLVFEQKTVSPERLLTALENDFAQDEALRQILKEAPHKVGNNDPYADEFLKYLFDSFADELEKVKDNGRGGRIRPGSGSAQYYVVMTEKRDDQELKATADGRRYGDFISSSLAPSPGVHSRGIISELETYAKLDYSRICNGGPITMELSGSYFRNDESLRKAVRIIKDFVKLGCQQLQLNILNSAELRDAQVHPENYRDLIVRVWGWSGYFVELAKPYQDQIIGRQAFGE